MAGRTMDLVSPPYALVLDLRRARQDVREDRGPPLAIPDPLSAINRPRSQVPRMKSTTTAASSSPLSS